MSTSRIISRKTMGLDNRVWFSMFGVVLLIESFLVTKMFTHTKCIPFSFIVQSITPHSDTAFKIDETVSFVASVNNENITWDFDDNSPKGEGSVVTHRFVTANTFQVKATLNSNCPPVIRQITVIKDAPLRPPTILGLDSIQYRKAIIFSCTDIASTYDWSVKDHPEIVGDAKGSIVKYAFPLPGNYTILVTLNHNTGNQGMKLIQVTIPSVTTSTNGKHKTGGGDLPPPCSTPIAPPQFIDLLTKVMNRELASTNFSQYLCKGDNTPVIVNKKTQLTFGQLCQKLAGIKDEDKKHRRFLSVSFDYENNKGVNVIKQINVHFQYYHKPFLKWVWDDYDLK